MKAVLIHASVPILYIGAYGNEAIQTPALDRLTALIHDIEDGRRPLSFATFQDLIDTCTSTTMAASRS